jgi:hypothetical protein
MGGGSLESALDRSSVRTRKPDVVKASADEEQRALNPLVGNHGVRLVAWVGIVELGRVGDRLSLECPGWARAGREGA